VLHARGSKKAISEGHKFHAQLKPRHRPKYVKEQDHLEHAPPNGGLTHTQAWNFLLHRKIYGFSKTLLCESAKLTPTVFLTSLRTNLAVFRINKNSRALAEMILPRDQK
jgi:hypothetical protein